MRVQFLKGADVCQLPTPYRLVLGSIQPPARYVRGIKVFYLPTEAQWSCFKIILKFTLKQLLHVSVQSPSSGSVLFELAKVIIIKIIS
jgi:hypothetical protein